MPSSTRRCTHEKARGRLIGAHRRALPSREDMSSFDWLTAGTALFIVGMVWLRTRMHYPRGAGPLRLTRAGRLYFAVLLGVLAAGWLLAPAAGKALWPSALATPTLSRVVCFLATYYLFIPVHHALRGQGVEVFKAPVADVQDH